MGDSSTDPLRLVGFSLLGDQPMHLHRHSFELVNFAGRATSGIIKDVVNVPRMPSVQVAATCVRCRHNS